MSNESTDRRTHRALASLGIAALLGIAAFPSPGWAQDEGERPSEVAPERPDAELEADPIETAPSEPSEPTETSETSEPEELDAPAPIDLERASDDPEPASDEPASDAPASDTEEEEPAAPPRGPALRFANSFFSWTNSTTFNTFAPGAQLSYDPTWWMSFSFNPRFYLTDSTFLWLSQGLALELTDTNDATYNHEPQLDDTLLDLRQLLRWESFVIQLQARLGFPLSKLSQAAGRVMQTGLGLTITRPFPELASFTVSVTGGYRRWWSTRNFVGTLEPVYGSCEQIVGNMPSFCTHAGAGTPARDIVVTGLALSVMPADGLTVSFSAFYLGLYGEEIATTEVPINGGGITVADDSPTHWRHFTYFSLAVGYDVLPWLNLSLGIQNSGIAAPLYNADGSVRSPFNTDTQIYLTTTIGLDGLYDELVGSQEETLSPEERQRRRQGLARSGSPTAF